MATGGHNGEPMISITRGITPEHLQAVYSDPYIQKIGHDGRQAGPVVHPCAEYLSAWVDDVFAGAFLVVHYTKWEIEAHSLLFRCSLPHSRAIGQAFVRWAFSDPDVMRITANVIEGLEKSVNFAKRIGFSYEGFRRCALLVNSQPKGIHVLGLLRSEANL